jgi:hypothetical protein
MLFKPLTLIAGFSVLCGSCANIVTPSGGERDVDPPVLVKAVPESGALNFNVKLIEFEFNEYIQLKDPIQKVVISPPLSQQPDFKVRKKKLMMLIKDTLLPSTTYSINFGTAISDITEGNAVQNLTYVFSTGNFLDSLSVKGSVKEMITGKPAGNVLVMLYTGQKDSLPYLQKPSYFSRTNNEGDFEINHIGMRPFQLFALKDENQNYRYDNENEWIGFLNEPVFPDSVISRQIDIFQGEPWKQRLVKSSSDAPGRVKLIFARPLGNIRFSALSGFGSAPTWINTSLSLTRDTITAWVEDTLTGSVTFSWTDNNSDPDTVTVYMFSSKKGSGFQKSTQPLPYLKVSVEDNGWISPGDTLVISLINPVMNIDTSLISLMKDSLQRVPVILHQTTGFPDKVKIVTDAKDQVDYRLIIEKGALKDVYNRVNDSVAVNFKLRAERDFGNIYLKMLLPDENFPCLVQLINGSGNVVSQKPITGSGKISFEQIIPGVYRLRCIYDTNLNEKWDTGNYLFGIQPENVVYFSEGNTVRANWDIELTWKIEK